MTQEKLPVTDGELDELAGKLERVGDMVDRLTIAATDTLARNGVAGPHVQSQPCSRPPYDIGAQDLIDELSNELSTTVRHICEHRKVDPDPMGLEATAAWLKKHRVAIAVMADGREIFESLRRVLDRCARSTGTLEREYHVNHKMVIEANRQVVTADQVEKLAHKLGDQAKGLTARRVKHLRERKLLNGSRDVDTGLWFYHLGDVLAAHKRARETRARPKMLQA
ncbi:hypothetical protein [Gordonia insulae]|uniref:Uncharacterized protein n=1 Tax=Gordonia insulae TaxID=2420509 RepID=A0A3G8JGT1_9ACTN|nr:hypothetical protein [Gordonia insulae]AZG43460.1 hypothetical protein D7316_00024 [Gordonia insulae]